jgi:hypothetical protein
MEMQFESSHSSENRFFGPAELPVCTFNLPLRPANLPVCSICRFRIFALLSFAATKFDNLHFQNLMFKMLSFSRVFGLLLLLLFAIAGPVWGQSITEQLQKQIWPGAQQYSLNDWENLLPAADVDTLRDGQFAEVIQRDMAGWPVVVTQLALVDGHWEAQARWEVKYGKHGLILALNSWAAKEGLWLPESKTELSNHYFEMQFWVDGHWESSYRQALPREAAFSSAFE